MLNVTELNCQPIRPDRTAAAEAFEPAHISQARPANDPDFDRQQRLQRRLRRQRRSSQAARQTISGWRVALW